MDKFDYYDLLAIIYVGLTLFFTANKVRQDLEAANIDLFHTHKEFWSNTVVFGKYSLYGASKLLAIIPYWIHLIYLTLKEYLKIHIIILPIFIVLLYMTTLA